MRHIHKKFVILVIFIDDPLADKPCHRLRLDIRHPIGAQPVIRLVKHSPRDQIFDKLRALGCLHLVRLRVLEKGIQLTDHIVVIIKPKEFCADLLFKALHHLRGLHEVLKAPDIILRDRDIILVHLTQIDVEPQPPLHVTADIPQLPLGFHQLLVLIMDALCEPVAVLILQKKLVLAPVDRYHTDTVLHRVRALPAHLFMDHNDVFYLRVVHVDTVHEEQRRVGVSRLIHDHLGRQHIFVQVREIFIDMPQLDLIYHKPLDRYAVALFQIRVLVLVLDDICI